MRPDSNKKLTQPRKTILKNSVIPKEAGTMRQMGILMRMTTAVQARTKIRTGKITAVRIEILAG